VNRCAAERRKYLLLLGMLFLAALLLCFGAATAPLTEALADTEPAVSVTGLTVDFTGPLGDVSVSDPTITAVAVPGASTDLSATLQLAGLDPENPWDATFYLFGCTVDAGGSVQCPAAGLSVGTYVATVTVSDGDGYVADDTGTFRVVCDGSAPQLNLTRTDAYWPSYSDYQNRVLGVDFIISNDSLNEARGVTVVGALNTDGVARLDPLPSPSNIGGGSSLGITLFYSVPSGVTAFRTTVYAKAADACGNVFHYPAAFPGT